MTACRSCGSPILWRVVSHGNILGGGTSEDRVCEVCGAKEHLWLPSYAGPGTEFDSPAFRAAEPEPSRLARLRSNPELLALASALRGIRHKGPAAPGKPSAWQKRKAKRKTEKRSRRRNR